MKKLIIAVVLASVSMASSASINLQCQQYTISINDEKATIDESIELKQAGIRQVKDFLQVWFKNDNQYLELENFPNDLDNGAVGWFYTMKKNGAMIGDGKCEIIKK